MKLSILSLFVSMFLSDSSAIRFGRVLPPREEPLSSVQARRLPQVLDHFATRSRRWPQRYYINDQYWKGGDAPIFLMVGGESEISPSWMTGGAWVTWAAKYGALLFQLEHRFYGQSHPTPNASTLNMSKYLRSEQALGDIAHFISQVNKANNFTTANKWILFGGSYSGNLVAWARLKYPHHVFGAVSSSSPLQAEADFSQYLKGVRKSLNTYSPGCAGALTRAIKSIQKMMQSNQGVRKLNSKFSICRGFDPSKRYDRALLIESLTDKIDNAVQYNNHMRDNNINIVCSYLNNRSVTDPVDRLAKYLKAMDIECVAGSLSQQVASLQQDSWSSSNVKSGARQWFFQTCNEFGYYQTSETRKSLLSDTMPLGYFTQTCTDVFGPSYNPRQLNKSVSSTNVKYGGTGIEVQRVVFVQGSVDPWHVLGMVKKPTQEDPLLFVQGTSHCYDMLTPEDKDPPSLVSARKTIDRYLNYWIRM